MNNKPYHWALMDEINPQLYEHFKNVMAQINYDEVIPPKYREMIVLGMAIAERCAPATRAHATACIEKYGVTKEELFCVVASALTLGGVPAYREACATMQDILEGINK